MKVDKIIRIIVSLLLVLFMTVPFNIVAFAYSDSKAAVSTAKIEYVGGQYHIVTGDNVSAGLDETYPSNLGAWAMCVILNHMDSYARCNTIRLDLYTNITCENVTGPMGKFTGANHDLEINGNGHTLSIYGPGQRKSCVLQWGNITLRNLNYYDHTTANHSYNEQASIGASGNLKINNNYKCVVHSANHWWAVGGGRGVGGNNDISADINKCVFTGRTGGVALGSNRATIQDCEFQNMSSCGISINNAGTININRCEFYNCGGLNSSVTVYNRGNNTANISECSFKGAGIGAPVNNIGAYGSSFIHNSNSLSSANVGRVTVSGCIMQGQNVMTHGIYNQHGTVAVNNTAINGTQCGMYNESDTIDMSTGRIHDNGIGVINKGRYFLMSGGDIYNNSGHGIDNESEVWHNGGSIYNNKGACPSYDNVLVGVYQNGRYIIGANASIYNNSILLTDGNKYINQSRDKYTGTCVITTSLSDREVGRELVKDRSSEYNRYTLSYGDSSGRQKAYGVKDDDKASFSGDSVHLRAGSNILKNNINPDSIYLSGMYHATYYVNTSATDYTPREGFDDTPYYWREPVTLLFSRRYMRPMKDGIEFEQSGWGDSTNDYAKYKTDTTYDNASNVLSKNKLIFAIWEEIRGKYLVHYDYNNGYGDESALPCNIDWTYYFEAAPTRHKSSVVTYDYGYDGLSTTVTTTKTFDGWTKDNSDRLYKPLESFVNLGKADETVNMTGNWTRNPYVLPTLERDDYEHVGWRTPEGNIMPPSSTVTPQGDEPITYTAVWREIEHTIIYNPNGATDYLGHPILEITDEAPKPIDSPILLRPGTDIGGKVLSEDTTYAKGYVNNDLIKVVPDKSNAHIVQYRVKAGDVVNNLGSKDTLASFKGWSKEADGNNIYNGVVNLSDNNLWGDKVRRTPNFVFYAVWDEFPVINANDIEISDSNNITKADLIQKVTAYDEEDGNITPNVQVINYSEVVEAFSKGAKQFSVIYEVTDSAGNNTRAFSLVKLTETYDGKALPVITRLVRTINRHAYNTHDPSEGGCLDDSIWYQDASYIATMNSGFDNMDNNTPLNSYVITQAERIAISDYIHNVGVSKLHNKNTLQYIVDNYMDSSHKNKQSEYDDTIASFGSISIDIAKDAIIKRSEQELERLSALRNNFDLTRIYR